MKTSPGPSVATSEIFLPVTWAIYPNTENITNPATKLVQELISDVRRASLKAKRNKMNPS